MTADIFAPLSAEKRLAEISDLALVEIHGVKPSVKPSASTGQIPNPEHWRARIAWPSDLSREHIPLAFIHVTRKERQDALHTCASRIRERCLNPDDWGLSPLELGRLLLYWEFRDGILRGHASTDVREELAKARVVLEDLVSVLEAAPKLQAELDKFCPELVQRLRGAIYGERASHARDNAPLDAAAG